MAPWQRGRVCRGDPVTRTNRTLKERMGNNATNLKADQFTLPVLELFSGDVDRICQEVGEKVEQAPVFFRSAPIVIDLKSLPEGEFIEFPVLVGLLRSFGLNPVGVRGGSTAHAESADAMELAVLADERRGGGRRGDAVNPAGSPEDEVPGKADAATTVHSAEAVPSSRLHLRPVRSGQKLAAPEGDLVLIASSSAGSELIASGNIHVYGALRGRALAGVGGDESCRIFCQRLHAELVSIAGHYRISEDIDESLRGRPVQIFLEAGKLTISPLGDT
jgi:septum site-determining protein MinC